MNNERIDKNIDAYNRIVWFVALERARLSNNFELAAKARQNLECLEVIVKYRKQKQVDQ